MPIARIQKLISQAGICSRRKAEVLILEGKVFLNNKLAHIGDKADLCLDEIVVNGYKIPKSNSYNVILLNKPSGVISSCSDKFGRKTVLSFLPSNLKQGMHPIGRLDYESRGAILLTNNGDLTLKLTHPRYKHTKSYRVTIEGIPSKKTICDWSEGIEIEGKKSLKSVVKLIKVFKSTSILKIDLQEGRNRQIRKTADILGHKVLDLQRISIAHIKLNRLVEGQWRHIKKEEWEPLLKTIQGYN